MGKMKRTLVIGTVLGLLGLLGVTMVAPAFAQEGTPPTPPSPQWEKGWGLGRGWGRGMGGPGFGGGCWATFDAVAEALGLTPEQLFSRLRTGQTLEEIAKEQGMDIQKVYEAAQAARVQRMKEAIQQAVKDGRMTQEQANWLLEGLEKGYFPMGRGFRFGFGRGLRCPGWEQPSAPPTPSSTVPDGSS